MMSPVVNAASEAITDTKEKITLEGNDTQFAFKCDVCLQTSSQLILANANQKWTWTTTEVQVGILASQDLSIQVTGPLSSNQICLKEFLINKLID